MHIRTKKSKFVLFSIGTVWTCELFDILTCYDEPDFTYYYLFDQILIWKSANI